VGRRAGLLRDPALRAFRIDIETDSTIEPNDQEEKQRRIEFVTAVGKYLAESLPVVQASRHPAGDRAGPDVPGARLPRRARDGRRDRSRHGPAAAPQQQQPQGPDPQAEQMKAQAAVISAQAGQQKNQIEAARVQSDHQIGMAQVAAENRRTAADHHLGQHELMVEAIDKAEQRRAVAEMNSHEPIKAPTR
jgi:hypothetical protein